MAGYSVCNINNLHNFHYLVMIKLSNDEKKEFISQMKLIIGMGYLDDFKNYIFRKIGTDSVLLQYF